MIKEIPGLPDDTLGFLASGTVTGADYEEVVVPVVEAKLRTHKRIQLLYQTDSDFHGYDMAALWDDTKLGWHHLNCWQRIAVVRDVHWLTNMIKAFSFLMPAQIRVFASADYDQALAWLSDA